MQRLTITPVSSNRKTGNIAVTGRDRSTCPTTCTFYQNGACYTNGRIDHYYATSQSDWTREQMTDALRNAKSDRLRDRVDGDIIDNGDVNLGYLQELTAAAVDAGMSWIWGYTHVPVTAQDIPDGYVMNASCETEDDVAAARERGLPAVLSSHMHLHGDRVDGRPVIQCPATRSDAINCGNCGGSAGPICARPGREAVVLFPPHGSGVKRTVTAIEARYGL